MKVVAALIERDGRFLVARRAQGKFAGCWEFPGGKMEDGETPEETIEREIREELNIEVTAQSVRGVFRHSYDTPKMDLSLTLVECVMNDPRELLVSDGSHIEWRWVKPSKLGKLRFPVIDTEIIALLKT